MAVSETVSGLFTETNGVIVARGAAEAGSGNVRGADSAGALTAVVACWFSFHTGAFGG